MDFFDFVKTSPHRVKHEDYFEFEHLFFVPQYCERLGEWIVYREKEEERKAFFSEEFDSRIKGAKSNEYIKSFFIEKFVNTKDKNGTPYFSEREVIHFIHANFAGFSPKVVVCKLKSNAKMAQRHINRTIYEFYVSHSTLNSKEKRRYCEMMRDNFHEFDNSDFEETIMKGFSKR